MLLDIDVSESMFCRVSQGYPPCKECFSSNKSTMAVGKMLYIDVSESMFCGVCQGYPPCQKYFSSNKSPMAVKN